MEFSPDRRKAAALVTLVFVLGIAFGVAGVLVSRRVAGAGNPGDRQVQQPSQLMRDLQLSADQERQYRQILADTRARYEAIREEMDPKRREVRQRSREQIRLLLTAEQRPGFEEFLRNSRNRRNDRNDRNDQNDQNSQNSQNSQNVQTNQNNGNDQQNGRNPLVTRLTQELHLTPDQQAKLTEVLRDTRARFEALRQQFNPQFEEARQQNRERLRQVVTAEQRPALESFFQRRDEERRRR